MAAGGVTIAGLTPVAPALYTPLLQRFLLGIAGRRARKRLWLDGDDALLVQPHALEDEREELALGGGVALPTPEDRRVFEHPLGLVEVGDRGRGRRTRRDLRRPAGAGDGPPDYRGLLAIRW